MRYLGLGLVHAWRWTFGLLTPPGTCKYHPTCSQYAVDAIREWGVARGVVLARLRLLQGDVPGAVALLEEAEGFVREHNFMHRMPDVAAAQVLTLLRSIVDDMGQTVLMVTHDPVAASAAHSVLFLADGRLAGELHGPTPEKVAERMTHLGEW